MKKHLTRSLAALIVCLMTLTGCTFTSSNYNAMQDYDFSRMELVQLEPIKEGLPVAVFDTDFGEFRAVLYEEHCPKTVAAFIDKANSGGYDGLPVYAVMTDVYFVSGGKENDKGKYTGRENDDGLVPNECSVDLWPFTGAILSYSEVAGYGDARWFICNNDAANLTAEAIADLKSSMMQNNDRSDIEKAQLAALFDKFLEVGGVFGLSGVYTVFGQVYEGMDVVQRICGVTADDNNIPAENIMVKSVRITTYSGEASD